MYHNYIFQGGIRLVDLNLHKNQEKNLKKEETQYNIMKKTVALIKYLFIRPNNHEI